MNSTSHSFHLNLRPGICAVELRKTANGTHYYHAIGGGYLSMMYLFGHAWFLPYEWEFISASLSCFGIKLSHKWKDRQKVYTYQMKFKKEWGNIHDTVL